MATDLTTVTSEVNGCSSVGRSRNAANTALRHSSASAKRTLSLVGKYRKKVRGAMSARSLADLTIAWWIPIFPAIAVFVLALTANIAGDGLRKALEPRLAAAPRIPVLGITGTGGAGKSSLVDELVRRFLADFADKTIAGPRRTTPIRYIDTSGDQVLMQGTELGYAWTMVVDKLDGSMSMTLVNRDETFAVFGYCIPP